MKSQHRQNKPVSQLTTDKTDNNIKEKIKLFYPGIMSSFIFRTPLKSPIIICTFWFCLIRVPSVTSISFTFGNIESWNQNGDIVTEGDECYVSNLGIQFTAHYDSGRDQGPRAGRAMYARPLHLWDNASGELANFDTNFTFVSGTRDLSYQSEGLTFFLSGNTSIITGAGALGLPINNTTMNATNQFVAVEFDTHWNDWDPRDASNTPIGDHVGIDINSIISAQAEKWSIGRINEAWVRYSSTSKTFTVVFTCFMNDSSIDQYHLQLIIDLRNELPEWVNFGFSASAGDVAEKITVQSWSFYSSTLKVNDLKSWGEKTLLAVVLSFVLCILIGGVASSFVFKFWIKKAKWKKELDIDLMIDDVFKMGSGPKGFRYDDLTAATNDFAEGEKLGQGGFGGVYRGFLKELGSHVAVKKVSKSSTQGMKEYVSEVTIISRLRHRNLVQLLGWCHKKTELLLVYEFLKNGSLDSHLFKEKSLLTWEQRYKIALGLASSVLYLHEGWEQCVLHRDIKSSNVMLDSSFNAKLGDFGLAKLVDHEKESETACLAGTFGYMAPERYLTGKASKGSDVYSFGVVVLEIACGRKGIEGMDKDCPIRLVDIVWELYGRGKLTEVVDPKLSVDYNEEQMERLMVVGLWCAHPDLNLRPSIKQAIQVLNFEAPPPTLPSTVPVPTYLASAVDLSAYWLSFSCGQTWSSNASGNPSISSQFLVNS